jgi:hypothetical protein
MKSAIIAILALAVLYLGYSKFHGNTIDKQEQEFTHKIDSINRIVSGLDSIRKSEDSVILTYKSTREDIKGSIQKEDQKHIQIQQKYHETRNHITAYDPNQLDSFFKSRYGY